LCLIEAKKLNMNKLVVSVREWNIPSQKIVERLNGVKVESIFWEDENVNMFIYEINL
jgi:predicted acetyltransferase